MGIKESFRMFHYKIVIPYVSL